MGNEREVEEGKERRERGERRWVHRMMMTPLGDGKQDEECSQWSGEREEKEREGENGHFSRGAGGKEGDSCQDALVVV